MRLQPLVRRVGAARAAGSICPHQAHQACSVGSAPAAAACAASAPRRGLSAAADEPESLAGMKAAGMKAALSIGGIEPESLAGMKAAGMKESKMNEETISGMTARLDGMAPRQPRAIPSTLSAAAWADSLPAAVRRHGTTRRAAQPHSHSSGRCRFRAVQNMLLVSLLVFAGSELF